MKIKNSQGEEYHVHVCKNCEQWKREFPKNSGHFDCLNRCTERGLEPNEKPCNGLNLKCQPATHNGE